MIARAQNKTEGFAKTPTFARKQLLEHEYRQRPLWYLFYDANNKHVAYADQLTAKQLEKIKALRSAFATVYNAMTAAEQEWKRLMDACRDSYKPTAPIFTDWVALKKAVKVFRAAVEANNKAKARLETYCAPIQDKLYPLQTTDKGIVWVVVRLGGRVT